eukprot:TRINITY_DN3418_c0_g1_i1.p1 TRINITY_DN3418_c0_g1~~TRINITY_DN3418_c0_g1_i1.p1  ORF type:complete len:251 (+),score=83.80 TRINITY_DN3418_c0_g1_i1:102-755(+)
MAAAAAPAAAAVKWRSGVLALYRTTLKQIQLLPSERRAEALAEARDKYRAEAGGEGGGPEAREAVRKGFASLGYLRTVTLRVDRRGREEQQKTRKYVWKNGNFVEGTGRPRQEGFVNKVMGPDSQEDPEVRDRLKAEFAKDHFQGEFWKDKPKPTPLYNLPMEKVIDISYRNTIGLPQEEEDDSRKLARNSVGSRGGVKMERARFPTAPWDVTFRGA